MPRPSEVGRTSARTVSVPLLVVDAAVPLVAVQTLTDDAPLWMRFAAGAVGLLAAAFLLNGLAARTGAGPRAMTALGAGLGALVLYVAWRWSFPVEDAACTDDGSGDVCLPVLQVPPPAWAHALVAAFGGLVGGVGGLLAAWWRNRLGSGDEVDEVAGEGDLDR